MAINQSIYHVLTWSIMGALIGVGAVGLSHWYWQWGTLIFPVASASFLLFCAAVGTIIGLVIGLIFDHNIDTIKYFDNDAETAISFSMQKFWDHTKVLTIALLLTTMVALFWAMILYIWNVTTPISAGFSSVLYWHFLSPTLASCTVLAFVCTNLYYLFEGNLDRQKHMQNTVLRNPGKSGSRLDAKCSDLTIDALSYLNEDSDNQSLTFGQSLWHAVYSMLLKPLLLGSLVAVALMTANLWLASMGTAVAIPSIAGIGTNLSLWLGCMIIVTSLKWIIHALNCLPNNPPASHAYVDYHRNQTAMNAVLRALPTFCIYFGAVFLSFELLSLGYSVWWFQLAYNSTIPANWNAIVLQLILLAAIVTPCCIAAWRFLAPSEGDHIAHLVETAHSDVHLKAQTTSNHTALPTRGGRSQGPDRGGRSQVPEARLAINPE